MAARDHRQPCARGTDRMLPGSRLDEAAVLLLPWVLGGKA